jgi:hypothetical protein
VFLTDDFSNDSSVQYILSIIHKYPRLNNRFTIVKNHQSIGALGNRDVLIRNYCREGSIILELDADDALIGKQVFNAINRLYQSSPNHWFVHFKYL